MRQYPRSRLLLSILLFACAVKIAVGQGGQSWPLTLQLWCHGGGEAAFDAAWRNPCKGETVTMLYLCRNNRITCTSSAGDTPKNFTCTGLRCFVDFKTRCKTRGIHSASLPGYYGTCVTAAPPTTTTPKSTTKLSTTTTAATPLPTVSTVSSTTTNTNSNGSGSTSKPKPTTPSTTTVPPQQNSTTPAVVNSTSSVTSLTDVVNNGSDASSISPPVTPVTIYNTTIEPTLPSTQSVPPGLRERSTPMVVPPLVKPQNNDTKLATNPQPSTASSDNTMLIVILCCLTGLIVCMIILIFFMRKASRKSLSKCFRRRRKVITEVIKHDQMIDVGGVYMSPSRNHSHVNPMSSDHAIYSGADSSMYTLDRGAAYSMQHLPPYLDIGNHHNLVQDSMYLRPVSDVMSSNIDDSCYSDYSHSASICATIPPQPLPRPTPRDAGLAPQLPGQMAGSPEGMPHPLPRMNLDLIASRPLPKPNTDRAGYPISTNRIFDDSPSIYVGSDNMRSDEIYIDSDKVNADVYVDSDKMTGDGIYIDSDKIATVDNDGYQLTTEGYNPGIDREGRLKTPPPHFSNGKAVFSRLVPSSAGVDNHGYASIDHEGYSSAGDSGISMERNQRDRLETLNEGVQAYYSGDRVRGHEAQSSVLSGDYSNAFDPPDYYSAGVLGKHRNSYMSVKSAEDPAYSTIPSRDPSMMIKRGDSEMSKSSDYYYGIYRDNSEQGSPLHGAESLPEPSEPAPRPQPAPRTRAPAQPTPTPYLDVSQLQLS